MANLTRIKPSTLTGSHVSDLLRAGPFPKEPGVLGKLQRLLLSGNQLTGEKVAPTRTGIQDARWNQFESHRRYSPKFVGACKLVSVERRLQLGCPSLWGNWAASGR